VSGTCVCLYWRVCYCPGFLLSHCPGAQLKQSHWKTLPPPLLLLGYRAVLFLFFWGGSGGAGLSDPEGKSVCVNFCVCVWECHCRLTSLCSLSCMFCLYMVCLYLPQTVTQRWGVLGVAVTHEILGKWIIKQWTQLWMKWKMVSTIAFLNCLFYHRFRETFSYYDLHHGEMLHIHSVATTGLRSTREMVLIT